MLQIQFSNNAEATLTLTEKEVMRLAAKAISVLPPKGTIKDVNVIGLDIRLLNFTHQLDEWRDERLFKFLYYYRGKLNLVVGDEIDITIDSDDILKNFRVVPLAHVVDAAFNENMRPESAEAIVQTIFFGMVRYTMDGNKVVRKY